MRRVVLAAVALTALAACTGDDGVGASELSESTAETTTSSVAESPPTTSAPAGADPTDLGYRWAIGDCVAFESFDDLPYEPYGAGGIVDCTRPHLLEVFAVDTFSDGPDAPFDDDRVSATVRETCAQGFLDYIGTSQIASGLDVVLYLPDAREWAAGLRYIACVVYDPRSGTDAAQVEGSFRDVGDAVAFTAVAGECSNDLVMRGPLLDCDLPHRYEHVGVFVPASTDWPGYEVLSDRAADGCMALVDGYVTGGSSAALGAIVGVPIIVPTQADWEAGFRSVVCVAAAVDQTAEGLVVIGSFAEAGWSIVEAAQAA